MTIAEALAKIAQAKTDKETLKQDIKKLEKDRETLITKAEAAAEKGNTDNYIALKEKAEKITAAIEVKEIQIRKGKEAVPAADLQKAWQDYAAQKGGEMRKKAQEYNAAKQALCRQFIGIVELQREAYIMREDLASLLDINLSNALDYDTALKDYSFPGLPQMESRDTITAFRKAGILDNQTAEKLTNVIFLHKSF